MKLVYKHEPRLFAFSLAISLVFWFVLIVSTLGIALLWLLFLGLFYLFAQSALIAYLKGTAVRVGPSQFPDLHGRVVQSCRKLGVATLPEVFLLNGDGIFNAFATRFLGRNFIVLFSDIVDAMQARPDALNFYIGHELGHIQRKHTLWAPVLLPASVLPLLGAAYSRAREYTCDLHGLACCEHPDDALRGLSALAAGGKRWKSIDIPHYVAQVKAMDGFWMSLHELLADYPWLVKRMARLMATAEDREPNFPKRMLGAWLLALFIPRFGGGVGPAASPFIMVALIGLFAAVAIPAYQDYTVRAKVRAGLNAATEAREKVIRYAGESQKWPTSNQDIGLDENAAGPSLESIQVGQAGTITLTFAGPPPLLAGKTIVLRPQVNGERVTWLCESSLQAKLLPKGCSPTVAATPAADE
jgi:Zn-dependent protease with chaperone function